MNKTPQKLQEHMEEPDGKLLEKISVKEAWPFFTLLLTAVVTYFATKAGLEGRINGVETSLNGRIANLETRMKSNDLFVSYTDKALVYHQLSMLRILKDEFTSLSMWASTWKKPVFKYNRIPFGGPQIGKKQPEMVDVVIDRVDAPFADPLGRNLTVFSSIALNDRFRAMGNKEFVSKTIQIYEALFDYNMAMAEDELNTGAVLNRDSKPNFFNMRREDAESRVERAAKKIDELKGLLVGMSDAAASEVAKIEQQFVGHL